MENQIDKVFEMIGKPFKMKDQPENDDAVFVMCRSGRVIWVEEKLRHSENKWMYHCQLFVSDSTITAYARLLDSYNEKELTLNDFVWL